MHSGGTNTIAERVMLRGGRSFKLSPHFGGVGLIRPGFLACYSGGQGPLGFGLVHTSGVEDYEDSRKGGEGVMVDKVYQCMSEYKCVYVLARSTHQ